MSERSYFTPKMNELIEVAGLSPAAVSLLVLAKGGTRITVPAKVNDEHWLVDAIGRENADKLCAYYCGEEITLPLGQFAYSAQRPAAIRLLDREGLTYDQIARRVGCDRRTVIRHVKGTSTRPRDPLQPELFGDHHPRPRGMKKKAG